MMPAKLAQKRGRLALWRSCADFSLSHSLRRGLFPSSVIGWPRGTWAGSKQIKWVKCAARGWVWGHHTLDQTRQIRPERSSGPLVSPWSAIGKKATATEVSGLIASLAGDPQSALGRSSMVGRVKKVFPMEDQPPPWLKRGRWCGRSQCHSPMGQRAPRGGVDDEA